MKSEHRHELETNWLAHHVAIWLKRVEPYYSLIVGTVVAIAAVTLGFSYFSGATAARQSEAWNSYNQSVGGLMPNMATLRESAEEFPNSAMQQWADVTWADGQVWMASRAILQNRSAANDALNLAISAYQSLLGETDDEQLKSRAHFGMGRVYELRGELDKARAEYGEVQGGFATIAELRIKSLDEAGAKDTFDWLATAQSPRRLAPPGPGTPGQRPDFSPGDLEMPSAGGPSADPANVMSVDDLFRGIGETSNQDDPNVTDRYNDDVPAAENGDAKSDDAAADGAQPNE